MRRLFVLLGAFLLATTANAELGFKSISVTSTSQYYYFPSPRTSVMLCNYGSDKVYYRLFINTDTPAVSTNANALLVAGTATAPICVSFERSPSLPGNFLSLSIIADSSTATVHVLSE